VQAYPGASDPTAVGGKRIVACIIDRGLGLVLYVVMFFVLSKPVPTIVTYGNNYDYCAGRSFCQNFGNRYLSGGALTLVVVVQLAYLIGVFVLQRGLTGRTLGMDALGIVTVDAQGRPLGPGKALVRSVAGIVDYLPCCFPLVGTITIFTTTGHRRVGDMAASSFVVPRANAGQPVVVPGLTPMPMATYDPSTMSVAPPWSAPGMAPTSPTPVVTPPTAAAPPTAPDAPSVATDPPPAAPDPTQPQWDAARGAYIQWDPAGQRWMQFDQTTQQWGPIS
jgi:uncharacterized RDD family membrane protein YckC